MLAHTQQQRHPFLRLLTCAVPALAVVRDAACVIARLLWLGPIARREETIHVRHYSCLKAE